MIAFLETSQSTEARERLLCEQKCMNPSNPKNPNEVQGCNQSLFQGAIGELVKSRTRYIDCLLTLTEYEESYESPIGTSNAQLHKLIQADNTSRIERETTRWTMNSVLRWCDKLKFCW